MAEASGEGGTQDSLQPPSGVGLQTEGNDEENMINVRHLLVERMDLESGLVDKLLQLRGLTYPETVKLKSEKPCDRNDKLLEFVFSGKKHQALLTALTDTGQQHLVNYVRGNGVYRPEYRAVWPLQDVRTDILDVNRFNLVAIIDPCDLTTRMFSKRVINDRQQRFIDSLPNDTDKAGALLDMLRRGSEENYWKTVLCLHESSQPHVAKILENGGVLVQAHASNVGDPERVNEEEDHIFEALANILQNTTLPQYLRIRERLDVEIIRAEKGKSIVLYLYCKTLEELLHLHDLLMTEEFQKNIAVVFDLLITGRETRVSTVNWSEEEFAKAKTYFERKRERAETTNMQPPLLSDPSEQKETIEETKSDEGVSSEKKSLEAEGMTKSCDEVEGESDVETDAGKIKLAERSERTKEDIIAAIIRNNTDYLIDFMRPEGLVDKLHATECLTDDDTRYIKTLKHRTEKNDEILNAIDDEKKYNDLIICLRQTRQDLAADIVEKGGVVLKAKVTYKNVSLPDDEKRLVEMIGTLHDESVPKSDEVVQFLSQLRRGCIEVLNAQHESGIIIWLLCRSEGAFGNVCSMYKSKKLNKLLLAFFDILTNRQMQLRAEIHIDIEDTEMEFAAWPPKLHLKKLLPVAESVVCGITKLPQNLFVLCQNPSEVLVFESKDYSKQSKRIPVKEIAGPVDIVASHQTACLYITDVASSSVWKVTIDDGKITQWLQNVDYPYTLSLTIAGEVLMVRRGPPSTLEIYGPDGVRLHDIKLPPNINSPNHAVQTSTGTFFVSNGKESVTFTGISEIDTSGNTVRFVDFGYQPVLHVSVDAEVNNILKELCKETQVGYPCHLALSKKNQLLSADIQNGGVLVFDSQLHLEQIIGKDDVKRTLCLCCGEEDNQLIVVHGEKRVIGIYDYGINIAD